MGSNLKIVGEVELRIHHNLMVVGQADVDAKDSEYKPQDDIKDLPPTERNARRKSNIVTRSMAKKQAKLDKLKQLQQQHPDSYRADCTGLHRNRGARGSAGARGRAHLAGCDGLCRSGMAAGSTG